MSIDKQEMIEDMAYDTECPGCGFPGKPLSWSTRTKPRAKCRSEFTECGVGEFKIGLTPKAMPRSMTDTKIGSKTYYKCNFCGEAVANINDSWVHVLNHEERCNND